MSGPKHTPTALSGPCPSCEGRGYDYESGDWSMDQPIRVTCPDCAGSGKAENSITANEKLRDAAPRLAEALKGLIADLEALMEDTEGVETIDRDGPYTMSWGRMLPGGKYEYLTHWNEARAALREAGIES